MDKKLILGICLGLMFYFFVDSFDRESDCPQLQQRSNDQRLSDILLVKSRTLESTESPPHRAFDCQVIALSRKYDTRCTTLSPENIRQFVITGTGRSATTAMFSALKNIGLSLGHERVGNSREGGIGWPFAVYGLNDLIDKDKLRLSRDLRFRIVLHQLRYPLKAISSLQTIERRTFSFIQEHSGVLYDQPDRRRALEHWITWNALVDKTHDAFYRVEDTHPVDVCVMAGFSLDRCLDNPPSTEFTLPNAREHIDLTWEALDEADPQLAAIAKEMTIGYGYSLNRTIEDIMRDKEKVQARQEELMVEFRKLHPEWTPEDEIARKELIAARKANNYERKFGPNSKYHMRHRGPIPYPTHTNGTVDVSAATTILKKYDKSGTLKPTTPQEANQEEVKPEEKEAEEEEEAEAGETDPKEEEEDEDAGERGEHNNAARSSHAT